MLSAKLHQQPKIVALSGILIITLIGLVIMGYSQRPADPANIMDAPSTVHPAQNGDWDLARQRMVQQQMQARDIHDPRVLAAMRKVPRHAFVPRALQSQAYADRALPIEHGQTISQPYIVALMTQLASPSPKDRALDVGTGSGYQAAVLAELVEEVYSIEILQPLAESASERLKKLGVHRVQVRCGDGHRGWPQQAPFDLILVAAAPDRIPQPLIDQLAPGGRLVIPVGTFRQELIIVKKNAAGQVSQRKVAPVAFVPMTGEARRGVGDE